MIFFGWELSRCPVLRVLCEVLGLLPGARPKPPPAYFAPLPRLILRYRSQRCRRPGCSRYLPAAQNPSARLLACLASSRLGFPVPPGPAALSSVLSVRPLLRPEWFSRKVQSVQQSSRQAFFICGCVTSVSRRR